MINVHDNYWEPSPGYKYLSNGDVYSTGIYLGKFDSPDNWHDTNDEPPGEADDAAPEDYEDALKKLGVDVDAKEPT